MHEREPEWRIRLSPEANDREDHSTNGREREQNESDGHERQSRTARKGARFLATVALRLAPRSMRYRSDAYPIKSFASSRG